MMINVYTLFSIFNCISYNKGLIMTNTVYLTTRALCLNVLRYLSWNKLLFCSIIVIFDNGTLHCSFISYLLHRNFTLLGSKLSHDETFVSVKRFSQKNSSEERNLQMTINNTFKAEKNKQLEIISNYFACVRVFPRAVHAFKLRLRHLRQMRENRITVATKQRKVIDCLTYINITYSWKEQE